MRSSFVHGVVLSVSCVLCLSIAPSTHAAPVLSNTGGSVPYDNMQPSLGLTYVIATQGLFPSRNLTTGDPNSGNLDGGIDPVLGSVGMFAGNFDPRGFAKADGQLLSIAQNQALFSILGTTYGGDGETTFALPDLRGRVPIHPTRFNPVPGLPEYRLGQRGGTETSAMSIAEMPAHTHGLPHEWTASTEGGGQPEPNMQPYLGLNYAISLQGSFPSRSLTTGDLNSASLSSDPLIGGVGMFAGNFAPRGWAFAEGQLLPIAQNTALFSILGTTYGGDGETTFALPDLRGRTPIGSGQGSGLSNVQLGQQVGEHEVTLTHNQMPNHQHVLDPAGDVGVAGGGQSHENMAPSLGLNYVVALQGVFPSRNLTVGEHDADEPISADLSASPLLGSVSLFAGNFAPRGWAFADGQLLQISQYSALFSVLGCTYGGDCETTFALPDLRGRAALNWGDGPGLSNRSLGQRLGVEDTTLTVLNLANHTHTVTIPEPSSLLLAVLALLPLGLIRLRFEPRT